MSKALMDYIPQSEWAGIEARTSQFDADAALRAVIEAMPKQGGTVLLPAGRLNFAESINLKKGVHLQGEGGMYMNNSDDDSPTLLRFRKDDHGIVINAHH